MKQTLNFAERALARFYAYVGKATYADARDLAKYRVFAGVFLLLISMPSFAWVAESPQSFYLPQRISPYFYLPGIPPVWFMVLLDVLMVVGAVLLTLGWRARWATWLFFLAYLVARGYGNSFGKVGHGLLLPLILFCLSFSDWGKHYALKPDKERGDHRLSLAVSALLICFGMFTAGWPKLLGWFDLDLGTSGFLNWLYSGYFNFGRDLLLMPMAFNFPPVLLELLDYAAIFLELSPFFFLLAGRRSWRIWLLLAASFHLGNVLLLNIPFERHIAVYAVFFCSAFFGQLNMEKYFRPIIVPLVAVVGVVHVALRLFGLPAEKILIPEPWYDSRYLVYVALVLWSLFLIGAVLSLRGARAKKTSE